MPHFGLLDESSMDEADEALMRARLHIRGGRRRLAQGKGAAGVSALYDALLAGIRWFILSHRETVPFSLVKMEDMDDEKSLFDVLEREELISRKDVSYLIDLIEKALGNEAIEVDQELIVAELDDVMTRLGVMPFDEGALPPEDPSTF